VTRRQGLVRLGLACLMVAPLRAQGVPSLSVWYPFSSTHTVGQSVGLDCWPAYALGTEIGQGRYGAGLSLSGNEGNGLYLPNPVSFFGPEARAGTLALWVCPRDAESAAGGTRVIADFMCDTGNTLVDGYEIAVFSEGGKLKAKPSLLAQMEIDSPLVPDRWTHLALAWDCTQGTALFVDGERRAERLGTFEPTKLEPGWPGRIGCHTVGGGFPFAGRIDELRLLNRRLSDQEVADLVAIQPGTPISVTGGPRGVLRVRNEGNTPATVRVAEWLPARHLAPPYRGYLPFAFAAADPDARYWTAGACESEQVGERVSIAPGARVSLDVPQDPAYLGPRAVRVIVGDGLRAMAAVQYASAGLRVEPAGPRPLVFVSGQPLVVRVAALNDLGRAHRGTAAVELRSADGGTVATAALPLRLEPGARRETEVKLAPARPLAVGRYTLRISVGGALLGEEPLYVTPPGDVRSLLAVGATYVSPVDDAKLLRAMAADRVRYVRLSGKSGDYYSAMHNLEALLAYGLKAWRMPAIPYNSVCADEGRRAWVETTGRNLGLYLKGNPAVLMQSIAGEGLTAPPCYCEACSADFRQYLRRRYGTLAALNRAWSSTYGKWAEVPQLGSPRDLDETAERLKMMRVALELPAENQARWRKLFELDRTRAMDWKRWHEAALIGWYRRLAEAFHSTNGGATPIGEQPCWPNFESHVLFALGGLADIGGMDLYLPGEGPTTLGYAAELCLNFDMNASIFASQGKPLMVHELYVQDNSPPRLPEAQGWWLLGRGYNLLTYFTYDYYNEGVRAGLPLIFGLFDKAGMPYPDYESFRRFGADMERFAGRWDAATLRRDEPDVALFMGDDVSLANNLETGAAAWEAAGVLGHNGAYWLTERSGHAVDFINDDAFDRLEGKRALVVPWCHVVRADSVERMLSFARRGGTLIIDGPLGLYDDSYRPYATLPGGGLAGALGVTLAGYSDEPNTIVAADGVRMASRGVPRGVEVTGAEVVLRDAAGQPAVIRAKVGRGKVSWLLSSLGRTNTARVPDARALELWQALLTEAGVAPRWDFRPLQGSNEAVFDVAVRHRSEREHFAYLVSFFEPSRGELGLRSPPGEWLAMDALTEERVELTRADGKWWLGVYLPAYGTRVVRLVSAP